jgi:DNA-binding transcriptional regulator LsrR (DeoR family)
MKELARVIWRAVRVALAVAGGQFISNLLQQPAIIGMGIAPALSAFFKWLRDAYPKLWWIPL